MDDHDEEKRTEQNLFIRSGKSEAELPNNRRLRSTYCTVKVTDRHEASRGLSATAGLRLGLAKSFSKLIISSIS